MLSILGTIIGLLGSFIPKILDYFKVKEDHKHELNVLNVQAEMAKSEHQYRIEEINTQADVASEQAVYKQAEAKYTGIKWIDGILALYAGTIRPTITYLFMGAYILVKVAQYHVIMMAGVTNTWNVIWKMWNSEDMAAFMTIIGFWFGGRLLKSNMATFGVGNGNSNGNSKHSQPALIPIISKPEEKPKPENKPKPGEIFYDSPPVNHAGF